MKIVMTKLFANDSKVRAGKSNDDLFRKLAKKYTSLKEIDAVRADALAAPNSSFPQPPLEHTIRYRLAGLGSLGRRRFTAVAEEWQGGIIVREAKALAPSAWL